MTQAPTIHASAVLTGSRAVLIRGPAGSGKSTLAYALIRAADTGALPFARLIGDDRVHVETAHGRLLVRPAAALAGLIEIRGLGIRRLPHEGVAQVGLVVDLSPGDADRLPTPESRVSELNGIRLPRLAVAPGPAHLAIVIAALRTENSGQ